MSNDLDTRILAYLEKSIETYLRDAADSTQKDDKALFCALVQTRIALTTWRRVPVIGEEGP